MISLTFFKINSVDQTLMRMYGFVLSHIIYHQFYSKLDHCIIQFDFSFASR